MSDIVKESLNKLKVTLQNSNQQIVTFKKQNKDFRDQLVGKITSVLTQIQELSKNTNSANIKVVLAELDKTKKDLQQTQQELGIANQRLQSNQSEIDNLKIEKRKLEDMINVSNEDNKNLQLKMQEIDAKLREKEASQSEIVENIQQVNNLLAQQVANITQMLDESAGYNKEYDTQINDIELNLQKVINLLNNDTGTKTGGKPRKNRTIKHNNKMNKHKKNKILKGGYNWSNSESYRSLSSATRKSRTPKSK